MLLLLAAHGGVYGTVPEWVALVGVLGATWVFLRGGGRTALATLETANRVLEKRVRDLEEQSKHDQQTIGELRARTDVTVAIQPLLDWTASHEARDQTRFEATIEALRQNRSEYEQDQLRFATMLNVMQMIAERLGPDGT